MNIRSAATALLTVLMLGGLQTANAQYRYRPPAGPVMPRQLDYFRRDVGLLDPFNTFVNPHTQLDNQLQFLGQQQQSNFQTTQQQLEKISQIRSSSAAATGSAAGFMNYTHYYRLPTSRPGQPRTR